MLSDHDIALELYTGDLTIDPWEPELLNPASVDIRVDKHFRGFIHPTWSTSFTDSDIAAPIDPAVDSQHLTSEVEVKPDEAYLLGPGDFALACSWETVTLPRHLSAQLNGKSSLGRLGLVIHSTAGFIDPGFAGQITLELSNVSPRPIKIWPGMRIGQLSFFRLHSPSRVPYGGKSSHYQDQVGPTPSRSHDGFKVWPT